MVTRELSGEGFAPGCVSDHGSKFHRTNNDLAEGTTVSEPGLGDVLGIIVPDFSSIGQGRVDAITPILVLVIWAVALWAIIYITVQRLKARKLLRAARGIVADVPPYDVADRRNEIAQRAESSTSVLSDAWREFDETLVSENYRLFNTVPAEEFFNERLFAPKLIGNRFLMAVPPILTTLGLIGTFLGLTLGLRNLDLGTTPDELRVGIQGLVAGAALGFTASLWGVIMSLVVNVVERSVERNVAKSIRSFQERIDGLFTMRPPEHSLSEIAAATQLSSEALQVLHEKIGATLQESVAQISHEAGEAIRESIHQSLTPVMEDLTKTAANQSAEVFNQVSEDLTQAFRDIGVSLAEQLKESADSMRNTLDYMGERLAEQSDMHLAQAKALNEMTERQMALLDEALPRFIHELESAAETVNGATVSLGQLTTELERSATELSQTSQSLSSILSDSITSMGELAESTTAAARLLSEQQASTLQLTERTLAAADLLGKSASELHGGFDGLRSSQRAFLEDLESQLTRHSEAMAGWLAAYGDAVSQQTGERMDEWNEQTHRFTSTMLSAAQALSDAIDELGSRTDDQRVAQL